MKLFNKIMLLSGILALANPVSAVWVGMSYSGGTFFPAGPTSFADEVVSYTVGGGAMPPYTTATRALGPPGTSGAPLWDSVSLGHGGTLIVRFIDNDLLANGSSSADLYIYDASYGSENVSVSISTNGTTWISVGNLSGQLQGINIDAYIGVIPGTAYNYVRLVDLNSNAFSSPWAGADINAVGAITTIAPTIQQRASYRPSSRIYIDNNTDCQGNKCNKGRRILGDTPNSNQFQFNLEYDAYYPNNISIKNYNDRNYDSNNPSSSPLNFTNASYYGFNFNVDREAPVLRLNTVAGSYSFINIAHWTITNENHTPIFGTWSDSDQSGGLSNGDTLRLDWQRFHPYPDFSSQSPFWHADAINSEVVGYTYTVDGSGTYLSPQLAAGHNLPYDSDPFPPPFAGCTYNPNASYDILMLLMLACGLFYFWVGVGNRRLTRSEEYMNG